MALPHERAAPLLEPLLGARVDPWRSLGSSPIVNLHLLYDRRVLEEPFAAGVQTPVQYVFDRTRAGGAPAGHQYLAVSLSGCRPRDEDERRSRSASCTSPPCGPCCRARARPASSCSSSRASTPPPSGPAPGSGSLRPPAGVALPGLALAGTWTDTGWPATLESAVLSGHSAAAALLADLEGRPAEPAAALASG